jgi:hypothetical protein
MRGVTLNTVDIALDDALVEEYGLRIPVLKANNSELAAPIDIETLQSWLRDHCK